MKKTIILLITTLRLFAITLEEFEPYSMYNNPREEIKDPYGFAVENGILLGGFFDDVYKEFSYNSYDFARGQKKLFRIYREIVGDQIFYSAFYTNSFFDLPYSYSSRDEFENTDKQMAPFDVFGVDFPSISQLLFLQRGEELIPIDQAEYTWAFSSEYWRIETLQPWSSGEVFGYWKVEVGLYQQERHDGMDHEAPSWFEGIESHRAKRFYLNEKGENVGHISITASNPLIDKNNPFRYTIQSAFDQNPATSYVEDTEDDLIEIQFTWESDFKFRPKVSLQRRIINGYAKSKLLYLQNNRIKGISIYNDENYELSDNILDSQIIPKDTGASFKVSSLFLGTKFSDTCIAEIDLLIDNQIWLFGGFDE